MKNNNNLNPLEYENSNGKDHEAWTRPDRVVLEKEIRYSNLMDLLCHFDTCVVDKGKEKVDKCQDLKWELKRNFGAAVK